MSPEQTPHIGASGRVHKPSLDQRFESSREKTGAACAVRDSEVEKGGEFRAHVIYRGCV